MNKQWIYILSAGLIEVLWVSGMKHASNVLEWGVTISLLLVSFFLLMKTTKIMPVSTAYAIFTGIGTVGTVIVGILVFNDPFSWQKIFFIVLLLTGVIGLKVITHEHEENE